MTTEYTNKEFLTKIDMHQSIEYSHRALRLFLENAHELPVLLQDRPVSLVLPPHLYLIISYVQGSLKGGILMKQIIFKKHTQNSTLGKPTKSLLPLDWSLSHHEDYRTRLVELGLMRERRTYFMIFCKKTTLSLTVTLSLGKFMSSSAA
jgi:hypothetical protein